MLQKIILLTFFIGTFLVILEFTLKKQGYIPGKIKVERFNSMADLELAPNVYSTDSFGIYSVNTREIKEIQKTYDFCNREIKLSVDVDNFEPIFYASSCLERALSLVQDTCSICPKDSLVYPFRDYLMANSKKEEYTYLTEYIAQPINEHGFRSIPFKLFDELDKTKVLLIGDSYAWGLSAIPMFNSYADILLAKDYLIFNTGIAGADPAQYAAIAKKFIPILKPDLVLINFYYSNDFMLYSREAKINEPLEYFTNEGFLPSAPAGEFLTFDESLEYFKKVMNIPNQDESLVNWFLAKSRVGSAILWPFLVHIDWRNHKELTEYKNKNDMPFIERAKITKPYIDSLAEAADEYHTPYAFVVIPETNMVLRDDQVFKNSGDSKEALDFLFAETGYYFPEIFCSADNSVHGHFNNQGALKFADYLNFVIHEKLQAK